MKNMRTRSGRLAALLLGFVCTGRAQAPPQNAAGDLGGASWQLRAIRDIT